MFQKFGAQELSDAPVKFGGLTLFEGAPKT
jgi:hypothetical protein